MKDTEIIKVSEKSLKYFIEKFGKITLVLLGISLIVTCIIGNEYGISTSWLENMLELVPIQLLIIAIYFLILLLMYLFVKFFCSSIEITVTNTRIYGKTIFGKRVDLSLDEIISIRIIKLFGGVSIMTSSGRVSFPFMINHKDICSSVNELLGNHQNEKESKLIEKKFDCVKEDSNKRIGTQIKIVAKIFLSLSAVGTIFIILVGLTCMSDGSGLLPIVCSLIYFVGTYVVFLFMSGFGALIEDVNTIKNNISKK